MERAANTAGCSFAVEHVSDRHGVGIDLQDAVDIEVDLIVAGHVAGKEVDSCELA